MVPHRTANKPRANLHATTQNFDDSRIKALHGTIVRPEVLEG